MLIIIPDNFATVWNHPETNMTSGTNATMGGNMTSVNATSGNMAGPTNMTTP